MDTNALFVNLLLGGGFIAAATYLARKVIEQALSRDIASFQAKLSAEHDVAIEKLKDDLRMASLEREIRFSRLHEKRVEVLGDLYRKMAKAETAFADYTHWIQQGGVEEHKERGKRAAQLGNEFFEYFNENEVFLDDELAAQVRDIWTTFRRAWSNFLPEPKGSAWFDAWDAYESKAPQLRQSIKRSIQHILQGNERPARQPGV